MTVNRMTEARFNALGTWGRAAGTRLELKNVTQMSAENERILGTTFQVVAIQQYRFVVLVRDKHRRFQAIEVSPLFRTNRLAELALETRLQELSEFTDIEVPMAEKTIPGVQLFEQLEKVTNLNPMFKNLRDSPNPSAARQMLEELESWVKDKDGNLVRDFQTTGFDGRIWEIYLFAALTELDFEIDHTHQRPDFCLSKDNQKIFIEAVTANATNNQQVDIKGAPPPPPDNFWSYMENEMPKKFGSPLYTKMKKKYWEDKHVAGHPLILAIADFHAQSSMTWSHTAISIYLYGKGVEVRIDSEGSKYGVEKDVKSHGKDGKPIGNFFDQPNAEHISHVMFSNAGTQAKFNRMGVLAGFGNPRVKLIRRGGFNDPSPGVFDPIIFEVDVEDPDYTEKWADEIEIYHNPRALNPISDEIFPEVTNFRLENGELIWRGPSQRVLFSQTQSVVYKDS